MLALKFQGFSLSVFLGMTLLIFIIIAILRQDSILNLFILKLKRQEKQKRHLALSRLPRMDIVVSEP